MMLLMSYLILELRSVWLLFVLSNISVEVAAKAILISSMANVITKLFLRSLFLPSCVLVNFNCVFGILTNPRPVEDVTHLNTLLRIVEM